MYLFSMLWFFQIRYVVTAKTEILRYYKVQNGVLTEITNKTKFGKPLRINFTSGKLEQNYHRDSSAAYVRLLSMYVQCIVWSLYFFSFKKKHELCNTVMVTNGEDSNLTFNSVPETKPDLGSANFKGSF